MGQFRATVFTVLPKRLIVVTARPDPKSCPLRSHCRVRSSKMYGFFHISWIFKPFATKFGIVVHHHVSECCVTIFFIALQGRGHIEGSNSLEIFVQISSEPLNISCFVQGQSQSEGLNPRNIYFVLTISSQPLNLSLWNLVYWYIIMTWSVVWTVWVPIFKGKVTVWAHILLKFWTFCRPVYSYNFGIICTILHDMLANRLLFSDRLKYEFWK